jgi:hypothetical protein
MIRADIGELCGRGSDRSQLTCIIHHPRRYTVGDDTNYIIDESTDNNRLIPQST